MMDFSMYFNTLDVWGLIIYETICIFAKLYEKAILCIKLRYATLNFPLFLTSVVLFFYLHFSLLLFYFYLHFSR